MKDTHSRDKIRIMFVCLGNICRSPLAEGVFRQKVEAAGLGEVFEIRSTGTGDWHVGDGADARMCETAARHGVSLDAHRGAQFTAADLAAFDHVLVMDKDNLHDVLFLDEEETLGHKVQLFRAFDPEPDDYQVPDPYYGGEEGFETVYAIVDRTTDNLLAHLAARYAVDPS